MKILEEILSGANDLFMDAYHNGWLWYALIIIVAIFLIILIK